ncbi:gas vesicle protein [Dactylosporangium sp. NPDC000555]|uniref:gas vesicle protein n=1 Tax=Dactylosporangium sp. NPDC000555 TaxID=3154260 RepID=UPI003333C29A
MTSGTRPAALVPERYAFVDLLDRVLATGVVITGEVTLSIADVDLVYISLRALVASAATVAGPPVDGEAEPR